MEANVKYYYGRDPRDEWRWLLKADNHKLIAISAEGYNNERDCVAAIERVKNSMDTEVLKVERLVT